MISILHSRRMCPADLGALLEIERDSYPASWSGDAFLGFGQRPGAHCQVIEEPGGGAPIAFFAVEATDRGLYIANLAVALDWRRQGVGSFALRELERLARNGGARRIELDVQESNLPAQLLYRKNGYRAVGILQGHYTEPREDAYHMRKELA